MSIVGTLLITANIDVLGTIEDLFNFSLFTTANNLWQLGMLFVIGFSASTPAAVAPDAWEYVVQDLYPAFKSIGVSLLNLLFLIGFFREASDIRKNMTWEMLIYALLKVILANALIQYGIVLMREFFAAAAQLSTGVLLHDLPGILPGAQGASAMLVFFIFGLIYTIVAVVCLFMIFQTVGGRYINLYVLMLLFPIAVGTLPGGAGIDRTASSWFRTFLAKVFEIVVISLVLVIAGKIMQGINLFAGHLEVDSALASVIMNMFTMAFMAASVKGAEHFLQRSLGL